MATSALLHERFDRSDDIFQSERAEFFEDEVWLLAHMITNSSRNTYTARRTHRLQASGYINPFSVQVGPIRDHITNVYPHPEADVPV